MAWVRSNWLFVLPLAIVAGYYGPQTIVGFATLPIDLVATLLLVTVVSVLTFVAVYVWVPVSPAEAASEHKSLAALALAALAGYVGILVIASATADHIPLLAAFQGAPSADLSEYRETFLRTRTGVWQALNYAYVICNNSVMPIVVTYAFWRRKSWRYIALAIFVLGLSLTLQKGAIASAALPLIALFLMERRFKSALAVVAMMFAVIGLMYVLAGGRLAASATTAPISVESAIAADDPILNASSVPAKYNLLGRNDQLSLAFNRIAWIPYVTAIDWLRYQRDVLGGDLVLGRSIKPVAALMGVPSIDLEREVSALQWGQNATGTASSNSVYFVDAWVNFSIFGVIAYSALFALTIKLIVTTGFPPLVASAIVPVYTAGFVALPPVFLSGGLAIFFVLAVLMRLRPRPVPIAA